MVLKATTLSNMMASFRATGRAVQILVLGCMEADVLEVAIVTLKAKMHWQWI